MIFNEKLKDKIKMLFVNKKLDKKVKKLSTIQIVLYSASLNLTFMEN